MKNKKNIILIADYHTSLYNIYETTFSSRFDIVCVQDEKALDDILKKSIRAVVIDLPIEQMKSSIEQIKITHPNISVFVVSDEEKIDELKKYENVKAVMNKTSIDVIIQTIEKHLSRAF